MVQNTGRQLLQLTMTVRKEESSGGGIVRADLSCEVYPDH